jgi:hypothetical protein
MRDGLDALAAGGDHPGVVMGRAAPAAKAALVLADDPTAPAGDEDPPVAPAELLASWGLQFDAVIDLQGETVRVTTGGRTIDGLDRAEALAVLRAHGVTEILAVGNPALVDPLAEEVARAAAAAEARGEPRPLSLVPVPVPDHMMLLTSVAQLHCRGVAVDWEAVIGQRSVPSVEIPTYAFDRQRYWLGPVTPPSATSPTPAPVSRPMPSLSDLGAGAVDRPDLFVVYAPPRTLLQLRIEAIWREHLGLAGVGIDDPFFDLGGTSLMGLAIMRQVQRHLGVPVPPALLYERPTVRELAAALQSTVADADRQWSVDSADRGRRRRGRVVTIQNHRRTVAERKRAMR